MQSEVTGEMGRKWKINCTAGMQVGTDAHLPVPEGTPTTPTVPAAQAESCLLKNDTRD